MTTFIPETSAPQSFNTAHWLVFHDNRLLVHADSAELPSHAVLAALGLSAEQGVFVGTLAGAPCFAIGTAEEVPPPAGMVWTNLRALFMRYDAARVAAASRALQLVNWNRDHQFCGRCATPSRVSARERSRECPRCGLVAYPRISPAMMALVKRGRELLLARSPRFVTPMFSALAGFVEAGESVEDTVHREVREEVGVEVTNLRYFGSQSWPFPHSLMLAFVCDYAGGEIVPEEGEIAEARWFDVDALPDIPPPISIAGQMIRAVAAQLRGA